MKESRLICEAYQELVRKGKHPNFLFVGGGVSAIVQFDAFASFAKDSGIPLCGIIYDHTPTSFSNKFKKDHVLNLEVDDYILLESGTGTPSTRGGQLQIFKDMVGGCFARIPRAVSMVSAKRIEDVKAEDNAFFFLYPACGCIPPYALDFLSTLNKDLVHVVLEEGIGTYLMTLRDWWFLGADRANGFRKALKTAALQILWPIVKRQQIAADHAMSTVPFTLFVKSDGVAKRNPIPCDYSAKTFEQLALQRNIPDVDYSNSIIVATTRFAEHGAIEYEIETLGFVVRLLQRFGYRVIIRPHPAEKDKCHYRAFGVEIDEYMDVPLESLLAHSRNHPAAVLGFMSSSQLIANALWGIPSICIAYVLGEQWSNLVKSNGAIRLLDREIQDAQMLFGDYVTFPYGIEALEELIASLHANKAKQ